uniref:Uncharacterized protein n=1 Tax=Knipowitschia caucasica TaxID=637954 RepID=A0AAV2IXX0_KNICA
MESEEKHRRLVKSLKQGSKLCEMITGGSGSLDSRSIYELSFAEVNGTILSLLSENRRMSRFLPAPGGGRVLLEKKVERELTTLDVLCVNQCEGGNENQDTIEQNFYRGGEVSWWNFYFSEQPGSMRFIERDKLDYIVDTLIPGLCSLRKGCVLLNLLHEAGCGGTTLAKHTLWIRKKKNRCAVLVDRQPDLVTVAKHVVTLLKCGCKEREPPLLVLLMIDDFEDMDRVFKLQQLIEEELSIEEVQSRSPQVILLNCMSSRAGKVHEADAPSTPALNRSCGGMPDIPILQG